MLETNALLVKLIFSLYGLFLRVNTKVPVMLGAFDIIFTSKILSYLCFVFESEYKLNLLLIEVLCEFLIIAKPTIFSIHIIIPTTSAS